MEAIITATEVADDPVLRVANTWADHFKLMKTRQRKAFIDNYVTRCREHRFWTASAVVGKNTYTVCRLADNVLFYDGKIVQARFIKHGAGKNHKHSRYLSTVNSQKIPYITPDSAQAAALISSLKRAFLYTLPTAGIFDSMTTFSKAFRTVVNGELMRDVKIKDKYGLNDESADARFIHPRRRFYNGIGSGAIKSFIAMLNPDIVRTVRSVGCPSYTLYNWIAKGNTERRIQAVRSFPLFLPYVLLSHEQGNLRDDYMDDLGAWHNAPDKLGQLVDDGQRIQPVLSMWFGYSEKIINAVNSFRLHHTGSALSQIGSQGWDDKLRSVFRAVGLGNKQPQTKAEWTVWVKYLNSMPYDLVNRIPHSKMSSFLAGCPAWGAPEWRDLMRKASDLRDVDFHAREFGATVIQPVTRVIDWSFRQLLNLSDQWHAMRDQVVLELSKEDELNATSEDRPWPTLLRESITHAETSIEIVELTVPGDLFVEGQSMRHCVDGYGDACYSGISRIVSLRKDGRSLATAEFRLHPWKNKPSVSHLHVTQLRGVRNAHVSDKSEEGVAFAWFLRQIKTRAIEVSLEWPNVPYDMRPVRMRDRDKQVKRIMRDWLATKLGIVNRATQAA